MLAGRAWCSLDVPSLYVRVYRIFGIPFAGRPRSLTIREGISEEIAARLLQQRFPHYT